MRHLDDLHCHAGLAENGGRDLHHGHADAFMGEQNQSGGHLVMAFTRYLIPARTRAPGRWMND